MVKIELVDLCDRLGKGGMREGVDNMNEIDDVRVSPALYTGYVDSHDQVILDMILPRTHVYPVHAYMQLGS